MKNVRGQKTYLPPNDMEIRSEEVQEIISEVPSWIIQWGITLIFLIIFIFLIATSFIQYPDKISARVLATTQVPPANIVARATGRLALFAEDQQIVKAQDFLGVIKSSADMEDVFVFMKLIEGWKKTLTPTV